MIKNYIQDLIQLTLILTVILSCDANSKKDPVLNKGNWVVDLMIEENDPELVLPFMMEVKDPELFIIKNASERIRITGISYTGDSIRFLMPVFGSEFKGKFTENSIQGYWYKYNVPGGYKIPFIATHGSKYRFTPKSTDFEDFSGKWFSYFIDEQDTVPAIGIFGQSGNKVTGTFLTETGDYRYLEGIADGKKLKLSAFDGAHAFLFEAIQENQNNLRGSFRSGHRWQSEWLATRDENATLSDMKKLTFLKTGYDRIDFSFPDEDGNMVSLSDKAFKGKVVILQIFGTWCPNCMDETSFLVELYNKYHDQGLEIIGLDFEPKPEMEYFKSRISRFRKDLQVPYTLLLAGHSNKQKAAESLPMLNHILSYPTAIFIGKKGEIREIHTGFSGPGTGEAYVNYTRETEALIEKMLAE